MKTAGSIRLFWNATTAHLAEFEANHSPDVLGDLFIASEQLLEEVGRCLSEFGTENPNGYIPWESKEPTKDELYTLVMQLARHLESEGAKLGPTAASSTDLVLSLLTSMGKMASTKYAPSSILVVDDIEMTRVVVADILKEMGWEHIIEAATGSEGAERLRTHNVSMVLCDYMMNGGSGVDLLRWIKSQPHLSHIPFVVISANQEQSVIQEIMDLGASDFISKPISFRRLQEAVGYPEDLKIVNK
jgi:CheY-like chemotaxis protein